ncbi:hypothetical protein QBC33DRAFT_528330 [Phialemonium atrogriseum]|uniref:Uncharacterized protein n=1 Tax=Phialemonium atrogriseum TaxID=1093897 RepID=A0AAJ0C8C2_9PEZI|nr:uncharacterized protein QBC33DRAFT_528330 [Phialemonium atrogriseum]KAK1770524.1 hypothetical protein QBC33DRAFT_528330 [Phialemonium atrogriseum]
MFLLSLFLSNLQPLASPVNCNSPPEKGSEALDVINQLPNGTGCQPRILHGLPSGCHWCLRWCDWCKHWFLL